MFKLLLTPLSQMLRPDNRISNGETLPRSIKAQEPCRCSRIYPALSLFASR